MSYKKELFSSCKGQTYQCDLTNTIEIHFRNVVWRFSVSEFLSFRSKLNEVDLPALLFDLSDQADEVEIIHRKIAHSTQLPLCELIALRELIEGTHFSLQLISLIHEVLGDYNVIEY